MITQDELKELLHYDEKTGIFTWLKDVNKNIRKGCLAGTKHSAGYVQITIARKLYLAHRLAWLFKYGYFPEHGLDHRDRNKEHNWITNLREASRSCNTRNTGNFSNNTSGVKGISFHKVNNKWISGIATNNKNKYICSNTDLTEAVAHRLAAEQCLNWEGCDSCSPAFQYMQKYLKGLNNG